MARDEQFGRAVTVAAGERKYRFEWVDGTRSPDDLAALAAMHFGFAKGSINLPTSD
jgi:hypothetical protein